MEVVETRTSLWEALAGRDPGAPVGPADVDLWQRVVDRLNPATAQPRLREGLEEVAQTSIRSERYVMLRSPDEREAAYLRLTPEEVDLAHRMDGTQTVAALVGEFSSITGRLAPDQVLRLVADLAGNRMLTELPIDVLGPVDRRRYGPFPLRMGRAMLATIRGRRMVLANPDRAAGFVYRFGGRFLFNRVAALLMASLILAGLAVFAWTWAGGGESVFLVGGSYVTGAAVLLGLNMVALGCHELGHALAAKHAGRRVPAMGVLLYFGLPSFFVDTTDVWMAGRRARLLTSAAGPVAALTIAGVIQLVALAYPPLAPMAFKIAFVWYLNSLFNLNPLMALDGYYLFMDWLEMPNLRPRAMAMVAGWVRRRRPRWSELDREGKLIAVYAVLAVVWLVVMMNMMIRIYRDRVGGLVTGLWHSGPFARVLLVTVAVALVSPVVFALVRAVATWGSRLRKRLAERHRTADLPRRVDALRATALGALSEPDLVALAEDARWIHPRQGEQVVGEGPPPTQALVVVGGALEGRQVGDSPGTVRARARVGDLVGASWLFGGQAIAWVAAGTRLLAIPLSRLRSVWSSFLAALPPEQREAMKTRVESGSVVPLPYPNLGAGATAPDEGVHPSAGYPPLAARPGEPSSGDDEVDRRLLRRLLLLLLVFLLLAVASGRLAFQPSVAWAEMSPDRVLVTVDRGEATALVGDVPLVLVEGNRRYLGQHDRVEVGERSTVTLTFVGGGEVRLCPLSEVDVGILGAEGGRPIQPRGSLILELGAAIADTSSLTSAHQSLDLTVEINDRTVRSQEDARYLVTRSTLAVERGEVSLDGAVQEVTDAEQVCPASLDASEPEPPVPIVTTTTMPTTTVPRSTTTSPAIPTTSTTEETTTTTTTTAPETTTTSAATTSTTATSTTSSTTTTTTTTTVPPPEITGVSADPDEIWEVHEVCAGSPTQSTITAQVTGADTVDLMWGVAGTHGQTGMQPSGGSPWSATLGPFPSQTVGDSPNAPIVITVVAANDTGERVMETEVTLHRCPPIPQ